MHFIVFESVKCNDAVAPKTEKKPYDRNLTRLYPFICNFMGKIGMMKKMAALQYSQKNKWQKQRKVNIFFCV